MTTWRSSSARVRSLVTEADAPRQQFCSLIQELNDFTYPVDGLTASEVHDFVCDVTRPSAVHSPQSVAKMAQLCFSLLSTQLSSSPQHVDDQLFDFFSGWLEAAEPATELLYLLAMLKPSSDIPQAVSQCVADMSVGESFHVDVKRAALHYLSVLTVGGSKASKQLTASLETISAQLLESTQQQLASVAMAKLVSSQLRAVCSLVKVAGETFLQPLLPSLLAGLKFYMTTGLPGQPVSTAPLPQLTIPTIPKPKKDRRSTPASHHRPHGQPRPRQLQPTKPPSAPSTSDSEVSDGEVQDSVITKALSSRLRHQALVCLTSVFTAIGPRTTFSYWLSFLPDGPRLPHSPPSILSCILRDHNHKCRSAALTVVCAMLEGTRPYLAAADDQSCGLAFTPFSSQLGGILSELHHCLILSLGTEAQPVVLTRAVRCLATLANTTPYHQLRSGYVSRILSALHPLSQFKDIDVRVACLTCGGAVLSTFPALPEVMEWLSAPQLPWLLAWCSSLLLPAALPSAAALQTGSLQILTAATKFYFSSMIGHWEMLVEQCLVHLTTPQQQHSLKLLEELCRASAELPQGVQLWSLVLEGPLTPILQNPTSSSLCSQACAVLATLTSTVMEQLQPSLRILALTLPLGLSRDDNASPSVSSSSVRVLGVYCTLSCLREDEAFLQDSGAAILHALTSTSQTVRVQASWALGNLTDALVSSTLATQDGRNLPSFPLLLGAARNALRDKDMVKCNAVRALGNLLKALSGLDDKEVLSVCSELADCISSGTMKLRWNACYACHSIFSSSSFPATYHAATDLLLEALCEAACTCPNFKVCTHASLALGSLPTYTAKQWSCVWSSTLTSLERSLQHDDFTEYRQAANLRTQLCHTLCHMLSTGGDLTVVPLQRLSDPAMSCLSACLNSASKEDRPMIEAAERKLSSSPAAVQANPTLMELLVMFQRVLDPSQ